MTDPIEIIGDNGDLWTVRECDAEEDCVVVTRRLTSNRQSASEMAALLRGYGASLPPEAAEELEEQAEMNADEWHVPADVAPLLAKALGSFGTTEVRP